MLEKIYNYSKKSEEKIVERVVDDEIINLNHMILTKNTGLPEHFSNSNVYMIIVKGTMTLQLGDQQPHIYNAGDIINIPYKIKMNVNNFHDDILEFFVVKSPAPKYFKGE